MDGVTNNLMFLREIDAVGEQLNEDQINKLRNIQDLVSNEFKKFYKPSEIVLNYIDLLLQANEANKLKSRAELISKLKAIFLMLTFWKTLMDEDTL